MTVDELLTKLQNADPDMPIVYEFGTYEGSVSDAEIYAGDEVDGNPVLVIFCEVEPQ